MLCCDKETLQNVVLGLYVQFLLSAKTRCSAAELDCQVCREMIANADTLFPRSFEISSVSHCGETTTDTRTLFGDRLALCRELVRLRPEELSDSAVDTVDRESPRALPLVSGTYTILGAVSVYATTELDEQGQALALLHRGSTVTVLAVQQARNENTIIGKVDIPSGWIRLSTAELSVRWAALINEAEDDIDISC
eukprot:TRINITY_DN20942_c0_g3_i1.p1 TRINITY_DN20942_c0_g3~~TRINITY_DN20942_c0_g3_i1.p1  ORF type:complete len:221 (-),score=31.96 TRINITY_DN20942_c0_g3_i1:64-648(-)